MSDINLKYSNFVNEIQTFNYYTYIDSDPHFVKMKEVAIKLAIIKDIQICDKLDITYSYISNKPDSPNMEEPYTLEGRPLY